MPQQKLFSFPNFHCYIFCKSHDPLHILFNCYNNGSATFFFCTDSIPIKNPTSFQAIYHYNEALRTLPSFKRRCFLSYLKLAQRVPITVLEKTHWGCGHLQTFFIFRWKWLFPANNYRMDPYLTCNSGTIFLKETNGHDNLIS